MTLHLHCHCTNIYEVTVFCNCSLNLLLFRTEKNVTKRLTYNIKGTESSLGTSELSKKQSTA